MADSTWVPTPPGAAPAAAAPRHSALVRVTHWLITLCFFALLLSGIEIVISHPRFYWGETGNVMTPPLFQLPIPASRASVPTGYGFVLPDQNGWSRSLHFQAAWVALLTGLLYALSGLYTRHFRKHLVPAGSDLTWRALSRVIVNHLRFKPPGEDAARSYNVLQRLTYLGVIFVLFPLMIWTGLAMSPAIASVFPGAVSVLGGQQSARTIHFFGTAVFVLFLFVHIVMVCVSGFRSRMRAMILAGSGAQKATAGPINNLSRRGLITTGLAATAGASGLVVAARFADRNGLIPPNYCGLAYYPGDTLTYASQRLLTSHSLAREFPRSRISTPFANGRPPQDAQFKRLLSAGFADWRLAIDGMVASPASLSLSDLRSFPSRSQITHLACEEGWSFIAEWIGASLSDVLKAVGILPQARYVVYFSFQRRWWTSIDMADALHPQTLLTYGMNDGGLPVGHGGPLRLRVARQLGYKNVKYVTRLTVTDSLKQFSRKSSYSWYAGI